MSKKFLVVNGPNLDMLGIREKILYGDKTYAALVKMIKKAAKERGVRVECFQSNSEGKIIDKIHACYGKKDGVVINAGGYTHTSVAILDALKAVALPTVEVHITDIDAREDYRKISYISEYAEKKICGHGFDGYIEALDYLLEKTK